MLEFVDIVESVNHETVALQAACKTEWNLRSHAKGEFAKESVEIHCELSPS